VPVPGSKTEVLCICILRASIVPVSVAFCIGFGAVPMGVVFFVFLRFHKNLEKKEPKISQMHIQLQYQQCDWCSKTTNKV
jgi:hypothetical protein